MNLLKMLLNWKYSWHKSAIIPFLLLVTFPIKKFLWVSPAFFFLLSDRLDSIAVDFRVSSETPSIICVPPRDSSISSSASSSRTAAAAAAAKKNFNSSRDSDVGNAMFDQDDNTHTLDHNLFHSDDFIALCSAAGEEWETSVPVSRLTTNISPGGESTPLERTCFEYLAICASDFTTPVWNGRGLRTPVGRRETESVGSRMVHEELNREEDTNVIVKRHVCTGDVRPREREGRVGRDRENADVHTRIGWKRAKGVGKGSKEREREGGEVGWDGQRFIARSWWPGTWGEK